MNVQEEYLAHRRHEEVLLWNLYTHNTMNIFYHHAMHVLYNFHRQNLISVESFKEYTTLLTVTKNTLQEKPIANGQDFVSRIKRVKSYGNVVASFDLSSSVLPSYQSIKITLLAV